MTRIKFHLLRAFGWFPLRSGGLIILLGACWCLFELGKNRYDYIMVVVGSVALVMVLLSILMTLLGGIYMWFQLRRVHNIEPITLVAGVSQRSQFNLKCPWWLPLISIEWRWELPNSITKIMGEEEWVCVQRRGQWDDVRRRIYVNDSFGISQVYFNFDRDCMVRVLPNPGALQAPNLVKGMRTGGEIAHPMGDPAGDRVDVRNYVHGDPMRYILWKVYARSRSLVVRTPERALQPADKTIAYLVTSPLDSAAAGAAYAAIKNRALGREWKFGVDGCPRPLSEREAALEAIIISSGSEKNHGGDLNEFVQAASESRRQHVLVFAPPEEGLWVERVIQISRTVEVNVLIGVDGIVDNPAYWPWLRHFVNETPKDISSVDRSALLSILNRLQSAGIDVQIADRRSGIVLGAAYYSRLAS